MATRKEHLTKVNRAKAERTKKKIYNIIAGMFAHQYKRPNGLFNITHIAQETNISLQIVRKYVREFENISK